MYGLSREVTTESILESSHTFPFCSTRLDFFLYPPKTGDWKRTGDTEKEMHLDTLLILDDRPDATARWLADNSLEPTQSHAASLFQLFQHDAQTL